MLRRCMTVLWPSFLAAVLAEAVLVALWDPEEAFAWRDGQFSRSAAYSIGFFGFWLVAAVSSALTALLERSREEINRCPLAPGDRPSACPRPNPPS